MGEDRRERPSGQRVTVDEAARHLGLTVDAVRKRVQRGQIAHEKDGAGRVWIILYCPDNASTVQDERPDNTGQADALIAAKDETIEELRDRVRRLEREVDTRNEEIRRRDHLLAAALERIPAIEARRRQQMPPRRSRRPRRVQQSPGPLREGLRKPESAAGGSS